MKPPFLPFSALPILILTAVLLPLAGCEQGSQRLPRQEETTAPIAEAPNPQATATAAMEDRIAKRINQIRQQEGLDPLQPNQQLAQVARDYSQQMANQNFFSHTSPQGETPAERVRSAGLHYRMVGENLFKATNVSSPVPAAVEGWMNSPGHRRNILQSGYTRTGVGVWRDQNTYYVTQLFMRSR